jgi:hypothetical protein
MAGFLASLAAPADVGEAVGDSIEKRVRVIQAGQRLLLGANLD